MSRDDLTGLAERDQMRAGPLTKAPHKEATMGSFRLEAQWVGGHGCEREKKDGEQVFGCGRQDCPDCRIREFVADMNRRFTPESAILRHWPGQSGEVQDNLNTKTRSGSF